MPAPAVNNASPLSIRTAGGRGLIEARFYDVQSRRSAETELRPSISGAILHDRQSLVFIKAPLYVGSREQADKNMQWGINTERAHPDIVEA